MVVVYIVARFIVVAVDDFGTFLLKRNCIVNRLNYQNILIIQLFLFILCYNINNNCDIQVTAFIYAYSIINGCENL